MRLCCHIWTLRITFLPLSGFRPIDLRKKCSDRAPDQSSTIQKSSVFTESDRRGLVRQLPRWLKRQFQLMVLADTAFGCIEFLKGIRSLKLHAITGIRRDRLLEDGRPIWQLHRPGQPIRLQGLSFPVTIAWFYLKRDGEKKHSKRYVLSTNPLKASTIV